MIVAVQIFRSLPMACVKHMIIFANLVPLMLLWNVFSLLHKAGISSSIMATGSHLNIKEISGFAEKEHLFTLYLTDEVCQKLFDYSCNQFQMSQDSLRENHDRNRKKGSFDSTLSRLAVIHNAGLESAVLSAVSHEKIWIFLL